MTLWVALVVLVAFSAFFSASETAFSSLNQIRLKSRADDGDRTAARVLAMAEKYEVDESVAADDLDRFLQQLRNAEILEETMLGTKALSMIWMF